MNVEEMKKPDVIMELQKLGVEVNPAANKAELIAKLKEKTSLTPPAPAETPRVPNTEIGELLGSIKTLISKVDGMDKEIQRMKDGGVNDFKAKPVAADVASAEAMNAKLDPRVAKIIENTLGVDFSADVTTFSDKPGYLLNIYVPQRLSPVRMSFRPVMDPATGEYKVDPKTKRTVEEEYWPGDTRSVALGSKDSFDVVQQHCNRVRAFILSTYQKMNRPQPEFRTR